MKKIVVITGGAGFIGSHMVDLCVDQGYRVHVIDNLISGREGNLTQHKNNQDVLLDNRDILDIEENDSLFKNAKYVFHFAGIGDIVPSIEQPIKYMSINVQGTAKVLEASRFAKVDKLVYAASSSCYGIADVPTNEKHKISPQYPYALSKYLGEQSVFHWNKVYKLPVNSIRIFNAYGLRSRTSGTYGAVFGVFLKQKLANKPFTVVGDGSQKRDYLYVTDVARAFLMAAKTSLEGKVWNLGASKPQTINYLVELLDNEVTYIPKRPGEPDCTWADITKIKKELGWEPKVSFEEGVKKVLDNIDYWKNAPLWNADNISKATKTWFKFLSN